ncbi:alpha/beta hydrolase [Pseudomonas massiliensis]|uniref:alpha/beta hydrolase n=1 Tax=Pseudomonas massiliensis TaxID=522492 RepID=UPI0005911FD6|nr:alpha/beta hydrolase-fold protein [Pseudomonas massiliensis]
MIQVLRYSVFLWLLLALNGPLWARPNLDLPNEPNLAERGSAFYRFTQVDLQGKEPDQHYRVWVAVPKNPAPPQGYPALYMLDGNAVLTALDDQMLEGLRSDALPVLVLVGYPVAARFDVTARAYDYTPPLPGKMPALEERDGGRRSGGADKFAEFIERRLKPAVQEVVSTDPQRHTLWGHSYGGLFGLHSLFTQPGAFQGYVLADPSLWWQNSAVLANEPGFASPGPARLLMMRGTADHPDKGPPGAHKAPELARNLAQRLSAQPNLKVEYQELPLSHGEMFKASLLPALRLAGEGRL